MNESVKTFLLPLGFTLLAALLELALQMSKGIAQGNRRYRLWTARPSGGGTVERYAAPLALEEVWTERQHGTVLDIEPIAGFTVASFSALPIHLILGAFAVDLTTLVTLTSQFDYRAHLGRIVPIIFVHIGMLIGVVLLTACVNSIPPTREYPRNRLIWATIGISFAAMMLSFLVL